MTAVGSVLIVARTETQAAAVHAFARLPAGASRSFYPHLDHTGISTWRHEYPALPGADAEGLFVLVGHNDVTHLAHHQAAR
jgi:hypothetical protein